MDNLRVSFYFISLMKSLVKKTCILLKKYFEAEDQRTSTWSRKPFRLKKKNGHSILIINIKNV